MSAEMWTAVRQEKTTATFEVRTLDHDPSDVRTVQLRLSELADMLREGGIPTTMEKLEQMKLVASPFPFRFRKTILGPKRYKIALVQ